jgi:hypothetical protein
MNTYKRAIARIKQVWSHIYKHPVWAAVVAGLLVVAILASPLGVAALARHFEPQAHTQEPVEIAEISDGPWGPSRTIYRCDPGVGCIGANHVVFDSTANDPFIGDERYFLAAKVLGTAGPPENGVWVNPGDTVLIHAFIANNAQANAAMRSQLTAHGTQFQLTIPTNSAKVLPLIGKITAANAEPRKIHDTVFLRSHLRFSVQYEWGSTLLTNRSYQALPLSDNVVGQGDLVGYMYPNGIFPPCLCDYGYVTLAVHINPVTETDHEAPVNSSA